MNVGGRKKRGGNEGRVKKSVDGKTERKKKQEN